MQGLGFRLLTASKLLLPCCRAEVHRIEPLHLWIGLGFRCFRFRVQGLGLRVYGLRCSRDKFGETALNPNPETA